MLKLFPSGKFKRDFKLCLKRKYDMDLLQTVIDTLRVPAPLPDSNKDHPLTGNWLGYRECHILPDWLLIYKVDGDQLYLARTGTHADLLNK